MSVNRVSITINSRGYTVVANESVEYIERLGNHINEKVESVIKGGQNIIGERPVVLAALNICDEYFKAAHAGDLLKEEIEKLNEKNLTLQNTLRNLQMETSSADSAQISIDETAVKAEAESAKRELEEANNKIKFLEGHIKSLENQIQQYSRNDGMANNKQNKGKRR